MGQPKLLIVDDEQEIVDTIELIFQPLGYEVVKASGGAEALKVLRDGFHGVMLLDIMMPGMGGWDTLRTMVRENLARQCLVLMLTAVSDPGDEACGVEEYVMDYVTKPFDTPDLVEAVRQAGLHLAAV